MEIAIETKVATGTVDIGEGGNVERETCAHTEVDLSKVLSGGAIVGVVVVEHSTGHGAAIGKSGGVVGKSEVYPVPVKAYLRNTSDGAAVKVERASALDVDRKVFAGDGFCIVRTSNGGGTETEVEMTAFAEDASPGLLLLKTVGGSLNAVKAVGETIDDLLHVVGL